MANIFRQAKNLLDTKAGREWTEEEWEVFGAAMIPLTILARYNDMATREGLEDLARIVEENEDAGEDQTPAPIEKDTMAKRDDGSNNSSTNLTGRQTRKGG